MRYPGVSRPARTGPLSEAEGGRRASPPRFCGDSTHRCLENGIRLRKKIYMNDPVPEKSYSGVPERFSWGASTATSPYAAEAVRALARWAVSGRPLEALKARRREWWQLQTGKVGLSDTELDPGAAGED